jgi:V8-like Glu-specific endopeptidase
MRNLRYVQLVLVSCLLVALCIAGVAKADERTVITDPIWFPWYTFVKVQIGTSGRGSGVLVAPCTILTNGHVVYNRSISDWETIASVHPGSYYDQSSGHAVDPFGSRTNLGLATNTGWADTGQQKYDYAAIFVDSSFESLGLDTYIPIAFESKPDYINVAGYPSEDLPSTQAGAASEQWWGYGDVKAWYPRMVHYEASSSGGQSGGPVWVYYASSGDRYLVGVNKGHTNSDLDGKGVRFVTQNEDLIGSWMAETCSSGLTASRAAVSFRTLLAKRKTMAGRQIAMMTPASLRLIDAPAGQRSPVLLRRVIQWIEGERYKLEEYARGSGSETAGREGAKSSLPAGSAPQERFIRLLQPENRFLTAQEAAVLLSASRLWLTPAKPRAPVLYKETGPFHAVPDAAPEVEEKAGFVERELRKPAKS